MYGFSCYDKEGKFLGWLYTHSDDTFFAYTSKNIDWCKQWKTERGAAKNLDYYNSRWQFQSKGGYLKVAVIPEEPNLKQSDKNTKQQRWHEKHPEVIKEAKQKYDQKHPVWSFRPTPEIIEWLEQQRGKDRNNKFETDTALLNRKLEKLRILEQQEH